MLMINLRLENSPLSLNCFLALISDGPNIYRIISVFEFAQLRFGMNYLEKNLSFLFNFSHSSSKLMNLHKNLTFILLLAYLPA